ncbi:serine/threonine-protein kinase [[Phormidium] sp. ETS-05]|uniref:serine/threonine-protein kinase n=1 Tax=[Phormidium] sp. ETS-05 TaxID=222819 RepID=UPI001E4334A8|nr:serine/threonine-protein kinase [[Phormidium] sp. ETS-05]
MAIQSTGKTTATKKSALEWEPGKVLQTGRYTIEKKIHVGGFGVTYLARDKDGDNLVVIKTLNEKVRQRQDFGKCQQDFLNEALRIAKCTHPHIVRVNEFFQERFLWCIVMEYVEGITLAHLVEKKGAIPEAKALQYIRQISDAVMLVHERGFLHRDIKPLNIIRRQNQDEVVLIDFGIAREFTPNLTQVHTQYYSDGFAPIEQYDKRALRGAYTDVYGLAATLYALVTNQTPEAALLRDRALLKGEPDPILPPQELNPKLSDTIQDAILKGMALLPENRPQSVADWLQLLDKSDPPPFRRGVGGMAKAQLQTPPPTAVGLDKSDEVWAKAQLQTPSSSAVGLDYSKLRELLASGMWEEADKETADLMLAVSGKEKEGKLTLEDVRKFPCRDLRTIDQLWLEYSDSRFGFSVQNQIWRQVNKNYEEMGNIIGWRRDNTWLSYAELTFDINAPKGHLPTWGRRGRLWAVLALRIRKCSL